MVHKIILATSLLFLISSCSVIKQSRQLKTFSECTFAVKYVKITDIAGVDVSNVKAVNDLPLNDYLKLAGKAFSKNIPSKTVVTINAFNTADNSAAINGLDWELYIKNDLYSKGVVNKPVTVEPGQSKDFDVLAQINLHEILHSKSLPQLLTLILEKNEALTLSDFNAVLAIKPWYVSKKSVKKYPGFIRIKL